MQFQEVINRYKESLRGEIPNDAWQYDVTERLRASLAQDLREKLRALLAIKNPSGGSLRLLEVHSLMRADLAGKYGMAGPDAVDAEVVSMLGTAEDLTQDDSYVRLLSDAVDFTAYKYARWQNMEKLRELTELCSTLDEDAKERGIDGLKRLTTFTLHMLCMMECDADVKPNFRHNADLARTRGRLKSLFMDQWALLHGDDLDEEEGEL